MDYSLFTVSSVIIIEYVNIICGVVRIILIFDIDRLRFRPCAACIESFRGQNRRFWSRGSRSAAAGCSRDRSAGTAMRTLVPRAYRQANPLLMPAPWRSRAYDGRCNAVGVLTMIGVGTILPDAKTASHKDDAGLSCW